LLFRQKFLDGIRNGTVTLAFRRWRRPSVRSGSTVLTPVGQLHIGSVSLIELDRISPADVRRAGYNSHQALLAELNLRTEGEIYRIELGPLRPDPRIALRASPARGEAELQELIRRLQRLDGRGRGAPWVLRILEVLNSHPQVRAADLCGLVGQEKKQFKLNVRKLKSLGLTESLDIGYRLSPRGTALLDYLRSKTEKDATL
jgi:hypothetical protein